MEANKNYGLFQTGITKEMLSKQIGEYLTYIFFRNDENWVNYWFAYNITKGIFGAGNDSEEWEKNGDKWITIDEFYVNPDGSLAIWSFDGPKN